MLRGHPGGHVRRCPGTGTAARQPLIVEAAQPAAADQFTPAPGDPAVRAAGQRAGPGKERRDRLAGVLAPSLLMPQTQAVTLHVALTARHRAAPGLAGTGRVPGTVGRVGVELLPADPGRVAGPPATVAAAVMMGGRATTVGGAAGPRGGPVAVQVPGEQPPGLIPLTRTPARVQPGLQPAQPA